MIIQIRSLYYSDTNEWKYASKSESTYDENGKELTRKIYEYKDGEWVYLYSF